MDIEHHLQKLVLVKLVSSCRIKTNPYVSLCTKFKSKWIKDLNIKPYTLNLIEEKVGTNLECISTVDDFLNRIPVVQALQSRVNGISCN